MKTTMKKNAARIITLMMLVCIMVSLVVPASATSFNQDIIDAKNGVVQIEIWYVDYDTAEEYWLCSGTGFLINEDTVVTCQHVVEGFSDDWYVQKAKETRWKVNKERSAKDLRENLELRVSVLRDVHVKATVKQSSTEMDFAILTLNDKLYNRTTLPMRRSNTLSQTESVYALGFPTSMDAVSDQSYYDASDVTITTGNVNKVSRDSFVTTTELNKKTYITGVYSNVDCVAHSAVITAGNSGGPLVDENGYVVGINAAGNDAGTTNLAISVDQLMDTCDALGIKYDTAKAEETPAVTEAPVVETVAPTVAPVVETQPAVVETQPAVVETQPAAAEKEEGMSMTTILIIAAVAVVAVIVVIVVVMGKKKPAPAPVAAAAPAGNAHTGAFQTGGFTAPVGAGETTVLGDAGETTILGHSVNGGTLIRKRNNETVTINSDRFVIGRERKTVNYCIADNSSVSRSHVTLTVRNGVTYLTDMNAANGTFVNGVKAMPNQEIALKSGDKIKLSDEEFEFRA